MNLDLSPFAQTIAQQVANQLASLLRQEPAQQWMSLKEAAEYLRCSEKTLYDMARAGEVPAGKLRGSWRFSRQELDSTLRV